VTSKDRRPHATAWPPVDLSGLRVLDALLRTESTVQAARELGLTQSAVSHALSRLRDTFDDPLFVRVGRRLVPTERARELSGALSDARTALERVLAPRVAFEPSSLRRTFRLACADYAELVVLPWLFEALAHEAPGVDLATYTPGDALEEELQNGRADLGIGARFGERAGLVHRALFRDRFVCVRRAGAPKLTLARYLDDRHVLVSPRGLPGGIVDDLLEGMGHTRRVVLRTPSFQTALALAARTELSATLPRTLAEAYAEHAPITIAKLPFEVPELRFGMMFAASRKDDASHRWFRERVAALLAKPRGSTPDRAPVMRVTP
jgi:DNA-binding transcriptional LysR family regulator